MASSQTTPRHMLRHIIFFNKQHTKSLLFIYLSKDPSPTIPTYTIKEEKGKTIKKQKRIVLHKPIKNHRPCSTRQSHTLEYSGNKIIIIQVNSCKLIINECMSPDLARLLILDFSSCSRLDMLPYGLDSNVTTFQPTWYQVICILFHLYNVGSCFNKKEVPQGLWEENNVLRYCEVLQGGVA